MEESADASLLSAQQSLQQDQLTNLDHPTFEPLHPSPAFQEAQQQAAAGTAAKEQPLASNLLQQSLACIEASQTAQAQECQAAACAQDGNAAPAEDIAPALEAGHVQEAQANQPASQSSFSLGQLQTHCTEEHRKPEPAHVGLSSSQQSSPVATAAGALLPVQQSLEARVTMDEADAEALDIGSVACAEAHHAELGEPFMAFASLNSDEASELKASPGQQVFSHVQPGPGTRQLGSDKGEPGFAGGQLGPNKGQPEVGKGQPEVGDGQPGPTKGQPEVGDGQLDISNKSGLPILQLDVSDGPPVLHSEQLPLSIEQLDPSIQQLDPSIQQLAPKVEQLQDHVEQLQSRPGQPSFCIVQAVAVGRQPDAGSVQSTQPEPQPESLQLQIPANLQMLECVQDHQHQLMQSQQPLPAASSFSSSLESHADAQQACESPFQLPDRHSTHEPAALQSQQSEVSNLELHVSAQQAYVSPFHPTQAFAKHGSAALQSQLSEALASSTSDLPLLYPEVEQHDEEGLSPQRLCSQLLAHLSVQSPGLQQQDSFQPQSAEAVPRSASALLQLHPGLEQPDSFQCQSVAGLSRSVSSLLQLHPGLEQPDSFQLQSDASLSRSVSSLLQLHPGLEQPDSLQHQSLAGLSRSVSSMLQLYPGLEQPHCCQTLSHADQLTKTPSTWLQLYPGLERPCALQSQRQSESASRCQSGVLQVYPGLEQQYQHTETAARSCASVLQTNPGLEQLGHQKMQQSSGTSSAATLEPPLQQCSRFESAAVNNAQQALGDKADQSLQPPESVCSALSSQPSNTYPGLEPAASSWAQYKQQEGAQRAQQEGAQHAQQESLPSMQNLEAAAAWSSQQSASEHHLRIAKQSAMMQGKVEQVSAIPPAIVLPITAGQYSWGCTDAATQLSFLKVCLHPPCESHRYSLPDLSA